VHVPSGQEWPLQSGNDARQIEPEADAGAPEETIRGRPNSPSTDVTRARTQRVMSPPTLGTAITRPRRGVTGRGSGESLSSGEMRADAVQYATWHFRILRRPGGINTTTWLTHSRGTEPMSRSWRLCRPLDKIVPRGDEKTRAVAANWDSKCGALACDLPTNVGCAERRA
jgi:hypothetical protein